MMKKRTRKRFYSFVSIGLIAALILSVFPANPTSYLNYNVAEAEELASPTNAEPELTTFENDDIIVEGYLPKNAVIETEKVDITIDGKDALVAYDINIYEDDSAKERGEKWQPDNGALKVTFKSGLITAEAVDVYHIEDEQSSAELVEENITTDNNQVVFEASSFSIYAIVEHEGDEEVITPRFTIHFLSPVTDTEAQGTVEDGKYYYTVEPYNFKNKANDWQTTQIIRQVEDGASPETLEMITNPPNLPNEFFFGWYVVNPAEKIENGAGEADDEYKFSWPESPNKITFETPVSVTDNGDKTFTMTWTADGNTYSETAAYDPEDYSAHIYVAPVYEDYCFVNFHEIAYAVNPESNLLTRKLVILGSDGTEEVLVSDVAGQSTDAIRKIFRGWQYRTNNTWISVQTMDNSSNSITKYINVTEDTDLFPYFQEGRWLYFNIGVSGNGATYVPAQFTLAEFNSQAGGASVGGKVTQLPVSTRVGYSFNGWKVKNPEFDPGNPDDPSNPEYRLVTDPDGTFKTDVNISVEESYLDNDGDSQTGVAYTIVDGVLTIKYPLSSLTFYADWIENETAPCTIVIWKQKVADSPDIPDSSKTYDYYHLDPDVLPSVVYLNTGLTAEEVSQRLGDYKSLMTNSSTSKDFTGFELRPDAPVTMSDARVRGDGSTIINIYYDRLTYNLRYLFARRALSGTNETGNYEVPVLNNKFYPPTADDKQTWLAYSTEGSGLDWKSSGLTDITAICGYEASKIITEDQGGYRYYFYRIRANYARDISTRWPDYSMFPEAGNYTLTSWWMMSGAGKYGSPGQNDTVKGVVTTIDEGILGKVDSEDGNFLIASYRGSDPYRWTYNIYFDVLEGVDYQEESIVTHNGKRYYKDMKFIARSSSNQDNQQVDPTYVGFDLVHKNSPEYLVMDYFYDRRSYNLKFDYNYPGIAGMGEGVHKAIEGIPYGTLLSKYDYKAYPDDTVNAVRPSEDEIPAHFEFEGWYEDLSGTIPFNFNTKLPAADRIVYGKWSPVYYTISIDPNGGVIDHINYSDSTSGGQPLFYVGGIASGTGEAWDAARAANDGDTSWAAVLQAAGSGHNTSQSTYFNSMYGTSIGQYTVDRTYVESDGPDDGSKYYYVNMQYDNNGEWGLHADLRNALYLTAEELEAYYKYCRAAKAWHDTESPGYYDGTVPETFEEFKDKYVTKNGSGGYQLYEEVPNGSYAFIGWYMVDENGKLSDAPYSFKNAVEGDMKLQAVWRRVGNYYIAYDPVYNLTMEDGSTVIINGEITAWTDPSENNAAKYNDGATTTTLQQPTGITANGADASEEYKFRGWQVVDFLGYDDDGNAKYRPRHPDIYYAEPTIYIIDAADADPDGCIHMQAVYEHINEFARRPEIANLSLNANDGNLVSGSGSKTALTENVDITAASGWTGAGMVIEDAGEKEVVFGNMQSNNAVHLYKYAVTPGTLDSPYDNSQNYFLHPDNYLLIGFDEGSDYTFEGTPDTSDDLRTGDPFIPTYFSDSAISVQRTDNVELYAVWEPMVYVDFTNRTTEPVTFTITGTGRSMSIVNEVTGVFSRERFTESEVTLQAGETIKFVVPRGDGETFTINGVNTSTSQLLNISSYFRGEQTGHASAGLYRASDADFDLTDTLHTDPEGVHVYFDGVDTIFFDVNSDSAEWTDTARTGSSYSAVKASESLIYVDEDGLPYEPVDLTGGNTAVAARPSAPAWEGHTFIGWTADPEAAECDPTAYTLPGTSEADGINNMAIIKRDKLWDFNTEVSAGMTLYAIWGENITVTFNITSNHNWNETDDEYFVPGTGKYTVTLAKGDIVDMPLSPTWKNDNTISFYRWSTSSGYQSRANSISSINNTYSFGTPVLEDTDLYTSWIEANHIDVTISKKVENKTVDRVFTFTAVITTDTYSGSVTRSGRNNNPNWNPVVSGSPDTKTESQTFTLKDGESVTLPLYFDASESTTQISSNSTQTVKLFFQSIKVTEASDINYEVSVSVDGGLAVKTDNGTVTTMERAPVNSDWSYEGSNSSRVYTLTGDAKYDNGTSVPIEFTNDRNRTDVTLTNAVIPDSYITGNEEFDFTVSYEDASGNPVTVPAEYASPKLKDGESIMLRGVPIGGKIIITETTEGWNVTSEYDKVGTATDSTNPGGKTYTIGNVPAVGGTVAFTNERTTSDITVSNQLLPDEYADKSKAFTYKASLWNGTEQVPFPAGAAGVTYSNGRKDITFTLKDDGTVTIRDLPYGYKLVVTQTEEADYTTAVGATGETKNEGLTYTIAKITEDKTIEYTNTLKTGAVKVTKTVQLTDGQTLDAGKTFEFTAKLLRTSNATTPSVITDAFRAQNPQVTVNTSDNTFTFTLTNGGSIDLKGLPVGYFLQLKETAPGFVTYVNGIRTKAVTMLIAEENNNDINYINRIADSILKIKKVDSSSDAPLKDARFKVYKKIAGVNTTIFTLESDENGCLVYKEASVPIQELSLESGTYYLEELTAPDGYKKLTDVITITVDNTLTEMTERVKVSGSDAAMAAVSLESPSDGQFVLTVKNSRDRVIIPTGVDTNCSFISLVILALLGAGFYVIHSNLKKKKKLLDE